MQQGNLTQCSLRLSSLAYSPCPCHLCADTLDLHLPPFPAYHRLMCQQPSCRAYPPIHRPTHRPTHLPTAQPYPPTHPPPSRRPHLGRHAPVRGVVQRPAQQVREEGGREEQRHVFVVEGRHVQHTAQQPPAAGYGGHSGCVGEGGEREGEDRAGQRAGGCWDGWGGKRAAVLGWVLGVSGGDGEGVG